MIRFFIGYCWGAAGSRWLARLLNSSEDILCLHSPILPRFDHNIYDDSVEILRWFFHRRHAYPIVGFTHAIPLEWHKRISQEFGYRLRCFALTRHPIPRIQSAYELNKRQKHLREHDPFWQEAMKGPYEELTSITREEFSRDFTALGFYKACKLVNSIQEEIHSRLPIFKLEDLVSSEMTANKLAEYISEGTVELGAPAIKKLKNITVGSHAARKRTAEEIYIGWSPEFKQAYHSLVRPESFGFYDELGYEFPHDVEHER